MFEFMNSKKLWQLITHFFWVLITYSGLQCRSEFQCLHLFAIFRIARVCVCVCVFVCALVLTSLKGSPRALCCANSSTMALSPWLNRDFSSEHGHIHEVVVWITHKGPLPAQHIVRGPLYGPPTPRASATPLPVCIKPMCRASSAGGAPIQPLDNPVTSSQTPKVTYNPDGPTVMLDILMAF